MRKYILPIILMAGLLLAACSGNTSSNTPTSAPAATTAATSAASPTTAATSAATMATTGTPAATSAATSAATMATTGTPAATAATTATTAATPAATTATTGTPAATQASSNSSNGSTASASQYISLTALLKGQVAGKDSTQVGQVSGILVQHPAVPAAGGATPTPAPTPSSQSNFTVRYVLVKASGTATGSSTTGDTVVVPWQAFNFASATAGAATATSYTLTVDSAAFNAAPRTTLQAIGGTDTAWASAADPYWTGKGLSIPMTGSVSTNPGNSLFLVTSDNDALKIADQAKAELGATSDILIDAATGQIAFFQFNGGSTLGNKTFVVPASLVTWTPGNSPVAVNNQGEFTLNFPNSVLSNFPSINLTNGLDANTLNQLMQFWQSITK